MELIKTRPVYPKGWHHPISISSLARVIPCPGTIAASKDIKRTVNKQAEFGTRVHEYAAYIYTNGDARLHVQADLEHTDFDPKAWKMAHQYLDMLYPLLEGADIVKIEERVFLDSIRITKYDTLSGTLDAGAVWLFGKLRIIDLKTGYVAVSAENNLQEMGYALGVWDNLDEFSKATITEIELCIIQINDKGAELKTHTITIDELMEFRVVLQITVNYIENYPDYRQAGEWCSKHYCPAALTCETNQKYLGAAVGVNNIMDFEPCNDELPADIDYAKLLAVIPAWKSFINLIEERALNIELEEPGSISGWKAVTGLTNRAWIDEKAVMRKAKELGIYELILTEPKLKTPKQIEEIKIAGEKVGKQLVSPETVFRAMGASKLVKREEKDEIDLFLEGKK